MHRHYGEIFDGSNSAETENFDAKHLAFVKLCENYEDGTSVDVNSIAEYASCSAVEVTELNRKILLGINGIDRLIRFMEEKLLAETEAINRIKGVQLLQFK